MIKDCRFPLLIESEEEAERMVGEMAGHYHDMISAKNPDASALSQLSAEALALAFQKALINLGERWEEEIMQ